MRSSRRGFLGALSAGAASLFGSGSLHGETTDPRLRQVLARTLSIDMHSHVGIPFGNPDAPLPHFDLPGEMRRTGFSAVIQTYEVDSVPAGTVGDYAHNIEAVNFEDRLLRAAKVKRALTLKDLENGHAHGQPMVIQAAEGAQFLEGHIERVDEFYRRGLRVLQPVHERDAHVKPLADIYTQPARHGGLSEFGAEVIRACNRLGIVIDLTHMSYPAVQAALKISTHPMIFSHTSLLPGPGEKNSIPDMAPRLLTKEEIRDIAGGDGIIGLWTRGSDTAKEYVENLRRVVDIAGIDHTGIGTDTDLEPEVPRRYTNAAWEGEKRGFFQAVAAEMLAAGFRPDEIAKIGGGNFCRVFGKVTAAGARA